MIHPHTELRFVDEAVGHGVFATRKIPKGTILWVRCRLDQEFSAARVEALPSAYRSIVERYGYIDHEGIWVVCWDHARYMNHSCQPTSLPIGTDLEVASRDILPGEQLTCEYSLCNISVPLDCRCGAPSCRGRIAQEDVLKWANDWDGKIAALLELVGSHAQPLEPFLRNPTWLKDVLAKRRPLPSVLELMRWPEKASPHLGTSHRSPKLSPHSGAAGVGLRADAPIEPGELLCAWGGEVVTLENLGGMPDRLRRLSVQIEESLFLVPTHFGSADRVNHSCDPNAVLRGQTSLVALRRIAPGEEITYDYATSDGSAYDEFACACGTARCRGAITGEDWRLPDLQQRYRGHFSPYLQARIDRLEAQRGREVCATALEQRP